MILPKALILCHALQIFFTFLAMCCFAAVASFQAKWDVGPCAYHPPLVRGCVRAEWRLQLA